MATIGTPLLWGGFLALVLALLALDLGVFNRRERRIEMREAIVWSIVWTLLALAFNAWIYLRFGRAPGLEFLTAYIIERSLSFDNLFVFIVIFNYFAVPAELHHRVLFWGILGALVARGLFIGLGAALLSRFEWLVYLFGAFLAYTGFKVLRDQETRVHPEKNPVLLLFRRFVRMTSDYRGKSFLVSEAGRLSATPLLLVLLVIETSDVLFAVDSIPAVFGVTRDAFIAFTSNIFAILGLRALYFLLASLMHRFGYLSYGLGLVLIFIGVKMVGHDWFQIPVEISLGIVLALLAGSIGLSLWRGEGRDPSEAP
ncbi:MAG TPA: TerC family protein [Thermoanaerobaculia bacterium]|nr:TerC family protein [Thermoanaerobaculia bacterium]